MVWMGRDGSSRGEDEMRVLYLDDIEQILRIFLQVQSKATNAGTETRDTPTSTFQVRNRRTTEIGQLPKITKTTNSFTLELESPGIALVFEVDRKGRTLLGGGTNKSRRMGNFPQARDSTQNVSRNRIHSFPHRALSHRHSRDRRHTRPRNQAISTQLRRPILHLYGRASPGPILGHFAEPKSAVILRYSYDQVARSEERNSKILIAAVSAALGVAATLLGMYAKHKLDL